jgi:hypothetical protein
MKSTQQKNKKSIRKGLGDTYRPSSKGNSLMVETPDSMTFEIHQALERLENEVGDVDKYVMRKLAYKSMAELTKSLSAEQIDAVALAIYNIEAKNESIIIGDQTGIGKGRIAAAMIRYGIENGMKPIFMTEKANLFSDLYRDLKAIGAENYRPYIVNAKEDKSLVKDEDGVVVFEPLDAKTQDNVMKSGKLPKQFDYAMVTYSQINKGEYDKKGNFTGTPLKLSFLRSISEGTTMILDESHNASGDSNIGKNLESVIVSTEGVTFLSATFAKSPKNMPIYAMKTAMREANLTPDGLIESITKGGVALQEVISAQLVQVGQMIRRERTYKGIEVNYITTDERADEQRAISDSITQIMRDIIQFQEDYINPEIKQMDKIASASGKEAKKREGTDKAGVDNTPYFSKVFQAINQMLFAIKADSVADRAIMRLKEGKKPVIAFASTMGSFINSLEDANGRPLSEGDSIQADFATVLVRALEGILRYTVVDETGKGTPEKFDIKEFSKEAQFSYNSILDKIYKSTTGITISPIDQIKQKLQRAGYTVAEVTGRQYQLMLEEKMITNEELRKMTPTSSDKNTTNIAKVVKDFMPEIQQKIVRNSGEFGSVVKDLEAQIKSLPDIYGTEKMLMSEIKKTGNKNLKSEDFIKYPIRFFLGQSQFFISEWNGEDEVYCYVVLNDDWQNAELGYNSLSEIKSLKMTKDFPQPIELDFYWTPKTLNQIKAENGLGKTKGMGKIERTTQKRIIGTLQVRKKENTSDAFRRFNNNEVDVLMINQSGSTGASAHAISTPKVPAGQVKQRVMIVLQAELDINTEVQKRGRINRTGQILPPIYDYVTCAVPAEKRLMMMLQKKLKSLDANTASNQKNSESLLKSDDFLNKYGDDVVMDYLKENKTFNTSIGDPFDLNKSKADSGKEKPVTEDAAKIVSGRVAVLPCKKQEEFYSDIINNYQQYVNLLIEQGEYDLEVEVQNLKAKTLERTILVANNAGSSPFSENTYLEKCEVDTLKKPYNVREIDEKIKAVLNGTTAQKYADDLVSNAKQTIMVRLAELVKEKQQDYAKKIKNITQETAYSKLSSAQEKSNYVFDRTAELEEARQYDIDKLNEKYNNQFETLSDFFKFFLVGRQLKYRQDANNESSGSSLAVSLGFKLGSNKKNKFTPSNISLQIAVASSTKQLTIPLAGKSEALVFQLKGSSDSWVRSYENMLENWTNSIKESTKDRMVRYIVTGNLLQFFGQPEVPSAKLIQFSTLDGKVRKGALLPESYSPIGSNYSGSGSQLIIVPINKCAKILLELRDMQSLDCSNNLKISLDRYGYKLILPTSRDKGGYVYLDNDVLKYVRDSNFTSISNKMVGYCSNENLQKLLDVLGKKLRISCGLTKNQFKLIENDFEVSENLNDEVRPLEKTEPTPVKPTANVKILKLKALAAKAKYKLAFL